MPEFSGHVNTVFREGDRMARPMGPWSPAVHAVLRHLERIGFAGSPRFLGTGVHDDRPVEWIRWIEGRELAAPMYSIEALRDLGALIRALHDASTGWSLPSSVTWAFPAVSDVPGDHVICHNDLSPRNTVCVDGRPVAFIDWDLTSPGPRVWDVVHAIWQFTPLVDGSPVEVARIRAMLEGYAMPSIVPETLAAMIALRMERTLTGIDDLADQGEPAFIKLRDDGVVDAIARDSSWVLTNAGTIDTIAHEKLHS